MSDTRVEAVAVLVDAALEQYDVVEARQLAERRAALVAIVEPLRAEVAQLEATVDQVTAQVQDPAGAFTRLARENQRLREVVLWALGEVGEFPHIPDDFAKRKFYWRRAMRKLFEDALADGSTKGEGTPKDRQA